MTQTQLRTKLLVAAGLASAFLLTLSAAHAQDYPVRLPDHVSTQTFALGATPFVKLSNINGSISVTGDGGSQVRLVATEKIRAAAQDLATEAQREVTLKLTHTGDSLNAYVDGPFRGHRWENPGYEVTFNFELHVPRGASVDLGSVNGGVQLTDVSGAFHTRTVNGGIRIQGVAGAGSATTVNGKIVAVYVAQPAGDSSFHTVNGSVDVTLPRGVDARLRYKTFNGSIYTDFDVTPAPSDVEASSDSRGMRLFRHGRWADGQIGHGGPQLTFNTLNGSIYIRRAR
ncbi:MAG: hypothetical protein EPN33_08490 [Acidobacteria bacterium]|nr:MAG: hypothetical protein EPN33_08490 [Acidobacteriota bacterium]